jgi:hypothetical protein
MVIEETVKDVHGRVLFPEGSVTTERAIQALRTWGVIEVLIADKPFNEGEEIPTLAILEDAIIEAAELFKFNRQSTPLVDELRRLSALHLAKVKMRGRGHGE